MLSISRKQLVVLVSALAIFPFNAGLSNANPVDTKEKKPDSKGKAVESKSKPGSSTSKPANSKSADAIVGDGNSGSNGNGNGNASGNGSSDSKDRHRAGKHGKHRGRDRQGGHQRRDDIPSFRNVKRLKSLTPVQEAKITHIIRLQREQLLPLAERLREIREASKNDANDANDASGKPNKFPESAELRRKIHAIKKDAWLKMQGILTTRQKIELEAHHDDESGPPRRNNPDARPSVHDSGKSFSQ